MKPISSDARPGIGSVEAEAVGLVSVASERIVSIELIFFGFFFDAFEFGFGFDGDLVLRDLTPFASDFGRDFTALFFARGLEMPLLVIEMPSARDFFETNGDRILFLCGVSRSSMAGLVSVTTLPIGTSSSFGFSLVLTLKLSKSIKGNAKSFKMVGSIAAKSSSTADVVGLDPFDLKSM